jgi:hypothetical protein
LSGPSSAIARALAAAGKPAQSVRLLRGTVESWDPDSGYVVSTGGSQLADLTGVAALASAGALEPGDVVMLLAFKSSMLILGKAAGAGAPPAISKAMVAFTAADIGGASLTFADTPPSDPPAGAVWFDTGNDNAVSQWDGSAWQPYQFGTAALSAGSITAAQFAAGLVAAGIVDGTTISGARFIAHGSNGEILAYTGTPALGNLFASLSGSAGSDDEGNPYRGNAFTVYGPSGQQVFLGIFNTEAIAGFPTGDPMEASAPQIIGNALGSPRFLNMNLLGPKINLAGHQDIVIVELNSPAEDGSSSANGELVYNDTNGSGHLAAKWDAAGFTIPAGTIAGVKPGTGTVSAPAVADGWQQITTLASGWGFGSAGDGYFWYKKLAEANKVQIVIKNMTSPAWTDGGTMVTAANGLKAGYRPANPQRRVIASDTPKTVSGSYAQATLEFGADGSIKAFGAAGGARLDGECTLFTDI